MARKRVSKKPPEAQAPSQPIPDRRALEKSLVDMRRLIEGREFGSIEEVNEFLQATMMSGKPLDLPPRTPLEEAQDVMFQAWDASGPQRARLARQALEISPDCADAYVLLAEEVAETPAEARALYEQGVRAGEHGLGKEQFKELKGHFWMATETRPYMRARLGLAQALWTLGEHQEAIAHMRALLRLNPGDNQGVRYLLMTLLLEVGDNDAVAKLLKKFKGDYSAVWLYTQALLAYRQEGRSEAANKLLNEAMGYNHFVPPYLIGRKKFPRVLPAYVGIGDEDEAVAYAVENLPVWIKTEGAVGWVRDVWATFKA